MKQIITWIVCLAAGVVFGGANLLQNGDFKAGTQGWKNNTKPAPRIEVADVGADGKALVVTVTEDGGKNHGQIVQLRQGVKPNAKYKVSARVKGPSDSAYVQVKLMKGKKEGARLSTGTNKGSDWCALEQEIETDAETTGLQIILRFRMNAGLVGKSFSFADVALVGVSGGAELDAAPEPLKAPEAIKPVVAKPGRDQYVTPEGAGARDGTSWADARAGDRAGVQSALDALGPGCTLFLAGGDYTAPMSLTMAAGGTKERPITVKGVDRGVKGFPRPVFTGAWKRTAPAKGTAFIDLKAGISFVRFENIGFKNYYGVMTTRGANHSLRIAKIDIDYCRDAFIFDGGMVEGLPESGTSDLEMSDCRMTHHAKKGVRTMNGVHHSRFIRCFADAGGKDYANIEPRDIFSCGFHVLGSYRAKTGPKPDHHIEFIDCEANGNYYDPTPKNYWNADGFCTEGASYDISFIRCKAYDNTDGGWDVKTTRPKFIACEGARNKRNFRVWSKKGEPVLFKDCVSADCWNVGKSDHDVGFWMLGGGEVTFDGCESRNDRRCFSVEKGETTTVTIRKCKATPSADGVVFGRLDGEVTIDTDGSVKR